MNLIELFRANVYVCDAGYGIKNGKIVPLVQSEYDPELPGYPGYTEYNPFDHPAMFMDFAALKSGRKPIADDKLIEFANRYGLIHDYRPSMSVSANQNTVEEWHIHVTNMHYAVLHWERGETSDALHYIYMGPVLLEAELNFKTDDLELHCDSLLSALYLQLYFAIKGSKTFNECAWCGSWFEILPPATRSTRKFCSNACKQAEYRHRKGGK